MTPEPPAQEECRLIEWDSRFFGIRIGRASVELWFHRWRARGSR
jgi:hypothetical protein